WEGVEGINAEPLVNASDIVKEFSEYAMRDRFDGNQVNILRISGGEPFFRSAALVEDIANEFSDLIEPETAFLWVDTNLHPFGKKMNPTKEKSLDALQKLGQRVAVHACIHGANPTTLKRNSLRKTNPQFIVNTLKAFIEREIPIYPRINPVGLIPDEVKEIFYLFQEVSDTICLPLKTYLGPIEILYKHSIDRMRLFQNKRPMFVPTSRPIPKGYVGAVPKMCPSNAAIFEWNRLLEYHYGVGYGKVPRYLNVEIKKLSSEISYDSKYEDLVWNEAILFCKGWEKEVYAQKMLEIMSVPYGQYVEVEFENKWIEPGLVAYASACNDFYNENEIKVLVTCSYKSRIRGMIPLRWAVLKKLNKTDFESEKH
ncbi:MAG: hypothetical protein MI756_09855, partial [Chromatiales bacterium]|nr:hypothetical protein [Chromatiales bacterium]